MRNTQIIPDTSRDRIVAAINAADNLVNACVFIMDSADLRQAALTAQREAWQALERWDAQ